MSLFNEVEKEFGSPVTPYPFQHEVLEAAKKYPKRLLRLDVGGGKTYCSIWIALWHTCQDLAEQIICIVPAPLVTQWAEVWQDFDVDVIAYQGTPAQRKKLDIENAGVIVLSKNIFRQEWLRTEKVEVNGREKKRKRPGRMQKAFADDVTIIFDEMQDGLRKSSNKIWKHVNSLAAGNQLITLSATPVSAPGDVFGVVKILGSQAYRTKRQFEQQHVLERDFFQQVTAWKNLDVMEKNLADVSIVVPKEEYTQLPEIIYDRVVYDLSKKHLKNYHTLVEEKLLETDNGLIDATESVNLFHLLQAYVATPEGSVNKIMLELLKVIYEEDDSPLIIFGNYRATNQVVLDFFGDIACGKWGDFSRTQQQKNLDDFKSGDKAVLVGNPQSLGVGTDGLQKMCYRTVFVEMPLTSALFEQSVGRIHRNGQTQRSLVKCLTARGTIQMQLYQALLKKDDLLKRIVKGGDTLRQLIS